MTGGGSKTIRPKTTPPPDPAPTPLIIDEIEAAKERPRRRKKGRLSNILAGRMMTERSQILKTKFGE